MNGIALVDDLFSAISSNFLHQELAILSVTSLGSAILDVIRLAVMISYHNISFLFRKFAQDYIVHMDMEIVIFGVING